jgi:hypothetical protein
MMKDDERGKEVVVCLTCCVRSHLLRVLCVLCPFGICLAVYIFTPSPRPVTFLVLSCLPVGVYALLSLLVWRRNHSYIHVLKDMTTSKSNQIIYRMRNTKCIAAIIYLCIVFVVQAVLANIYIYIYIVVSPKHSLLAASHARQQRCTQSTSIFKSKGYGKSRCHRCPGYISHDD